MEPKPRCNICRKKVPAKVKTKKLDNGVELHYIRCSKCHSIFPGYVTNDKVREMMKNIEKRQQDTASKQADEILLSYRVTLADKEMVERLAKVILVNKHLEDFKKLGERVIW